MVSFRHLWLDTPRLRALVSLALALGVTTLAFHLPWYRTPEPLRWAMRSGERMEVLETLPEVREVLREAPPPTRQGKKVQPEAPVRGTTPVRARKAPPEKNLPDDVLRVRAGEVLEFAQVQPQVVGGLRALYLRIQYPRAAREQGIQGRVILSFIVELDGTVSEVRVLQSVHPLLDSAAVRAVRHTAFIPGYQNGQPVRVRMRLPIRFQLIPPPSVADSVQTL